ncbi:ABC transporter permease [Dyadobacter chenwenxiniae]|uniref:ABC transporter permease n=1 Tax=Dyadobacter chenwenxiniae TaxID=2906456 RepID=A0A9X1PMP6_9BACT|nr:ABC transporter permease [Dyadobacter chenwenxiniae]MCF0063743.1 ABC transporter permease [Dyadobacter chenwenxiniae]UON83418.1 ABC transporter permease [Dyadobacter chenwenxiniae]
MGDIRQPTSDKPPRWSAKLLSWLGHPDTLEEVTGDMLELYRYRLKKAGKRKADWLYLADTIKLLRPFARQKKQIIYSSGNALDLVMIQNYFKIALRNLLKNKGYSAINITGLAVGMAVALLIGLWVFDELSFDKNHENYDKIAKVMQSQNFAGTIQTGDGLPKQLEQELRSKYGSHFKYIAITGGGGEHLLSVGDKKVTQIGRYMGPDIAEMLSLKMLKGTRSGLTDMNSVLLSESAAKATFGDTDPMDKIVKIDNKNAVRVTGVYADLPANSSFAGLAFIAPWKLLEKDLPEWLGWGNNWFDMYVQIGDHSEMDRVSAAIAKAKLDNIDQAESKYEPLIFLQPMRKWNLYSEFKNGVNTGGRISVVWLFGITGLSVLILACINFMNLNTARSEKRAKEIGVRKAVGSAKTQLAVQFLGESLMVVILAFMVSLLIVLVSLPAFNQLVNKQIALPFALPYFWLACIAFILLTGLVAGAYPALYLSSFKPITALKGISLKPKGGQLAGTPRKMLVVLQFTVSVTLIIGTIIVYRQVQHAKNRPIGYSRQQLLSSPLKSDQIIKHFTAFRNDLLNTGAVEEVTATDSPVTNTYVTNGGFTWKGKNPAMTDEFVTLRITHEFGKTVGWKIKDGRDFSREFATDSLGFVLNEAAVKYMGLKNPVGEMIQWGDNEKYKVIGVVKDLVTQSPYEPAKQTIFFLNYKRLNTVNIKIKPSASASTAVAGIQSVFKKYDPENLFQYAFADQEYARKFSDEERIAKLTTLFAVLAVLISCLGLFGLASFVAEQRTKEIGIRKVLGASIAGLWVLLSREFLLLVLISCLIAGPLAWYFMNGWLEKYTYRTEISWWIFAVSVLGAVLVTLVTVSFQAIRAALLNPVTSLRSE